MKVLVIIGTRPEAIKMAPVVLELGRRADIDTVVCLTAQHREMLDQVIGLFDLPVHYDLNLMRPGQSVSEVTARVLNAVTPVLAEARPDVVLVHGDTTTSLAAALAAYYQRIPVGHVEAGLRTYDKFRPFPEEMNRRLADALCDYHYAPTESAKANLLAERIDPANVLVTGNTVIDALLDVAARHYRFDDPLLDQAGRERRLVLVTAHRRESFGAPFRAMCQAIRDVAANNVDVEVIYPVHPNPNVRAVTDEVLAGLPRVRCIEPLGYEPFVHLSLIHISEPTRPY